MSTTIKLKLDGKERGEKTFSEDQLKSTHLMEIVFDLASSKANSARIYLSDAEGKNEKLVKQDAAQTLYDLLGSMGGKRNGVYTLEVLSDKRTCGPGF
ncbi:MAG: hypothetical protein C4523_00355 [Myxococcales bacterium]|nr:MAG: hypothetical protein C4523_00355 [Myxococcales bacterium]